MSKTSIWSRLGAPSRSVVALRRWVRRAPHESSSCKNSRSALHNHRPGGQGAGDFGLLVSPRAGGTELTGAGVETLIVGDNFDLLVHPDTYALSLRLADG